MVDIHSHILPGWDDGSRSMEESLEMLRMAAESGTTDIVATPHANSEFPYNPQVVKQLFAELKQAANGLIRVHLGSDFHVQFENIQDALSHPNKYTINQGAYLMVELPEVMNFQVMRDILGRFRNVGIVPIITHPERNMQLQTKLGELKNWVDDGCLLQVTGQSLLGRFGNTAQHCATQLLRDNLVHFIASDAHDTKDRTPKLDEAYKWVEAHHGADRAKRLFETNPAAVLANQGFEIPNEERHEQRRSRGRKQWWQVWK